MDQLSSSYLMTRAVMTALILLASAAIGIAQPAPPGRVVRVLTVGNSFSGNATQYLADLAAAVGHRLVLGRADLPGCPMERHWKAVEAAEGDPDDPAGSPYTLTDSNERVSLRQMLTRDKWDFVTIQQYSVLSHDPATYRPYAGLLRDYIRKHAPRAEVVVHETWAYRADDPRFAAGSDSQELMYQQLSAAYRGVSYELGLRMIPVGDAFRAADTFGPWRYRPAEFDASLLRYPELPDQTHSLHVGWRWSTDAQGAHKLVMDGHHANANGCYLAGCVWFEFLFGESVQNNPFVPDGVTPEDARVLRYVAHRTFPRPGS